MARKKTPDTAIEHGDAPLVDFPPADAPPVATVAPPVSTEQREPGDEPSEAPKKKYEKVRGWTQTFTGPFQYRKLTDEGMGDHGKVLFKFKLPPNEKLPPQEAIDIMHKYQKYENGESTGLKFENTRQHGPVWTIPMDTEGRAIADKIDYYLSQLGHKMAESQVRG